MNHYFVKTERGNKIIETENPIDIAVNPAWTLFTREQEEFFEENPDASLSEIKNMKRHKVPVQSIEEIRENAISTVSGESLSATETVIPQYRLLNAIASLSVDNGKIYQDEKSHEKLRLYATVGKLCRKKYFDTVDLINSAETEEDINSIVSEASEFYSSIIEKYKDSDAEESI